MYLRVLAMFTGSVLLFQSAVLQAADAVPVLTIQGQQFTPQTMVFPSGVKQKLIIRNSTAIPAEFESYDLSREIIVPAHGEVTIYIGPLEAGRYQYFNDFNHAMQGTITVTAPQQGH